MFVRITAAAAVDVGLAAIQHAVVAGGAHAALAEPVAAVVVREVELLKVHQRAALGEGLGQGGEPCVADVVVREVQLLS